MTRKQNVRKTEAPQSNSSLEETTEGTHQELPIKEEPSEPLYDILLEEGRAAKLNPTSTGAIFFQIGRKKDDNSLHIRIAGNEGGGLHSKEWISVEGVLNTIKDQTDKPFKSTLLKPLFKGRSSNNVSFLAGILRSDEVGLIKASDQSQFLHVLAEDFDIKAKALIERA